jgi:hypothetical protein
MNAILAIIANGRQAIIVIDRKAGDELFSPLVY